MEKMKGWIIMSIFSIAAAVFTGCGKKESWNGDENDAHDSQVSYAFEQEITSQSLPEGTRLKRLFITHQGMRGGSYKTTAWSDANYNYTKTDHFRLFRSGSIGFANIPLGWLKKGR